MTLLKYRCESCSKTFYVDKTETPGQLKMACPHCSNAFEGVKLSWMDDETLMISPNEIQVLTLPFKDTQTSPEGDAIFFLSNAKMFKLGIAVTKWNLVPDRFERTLLIRFGTPPSPHGLCFRSGCHNMALIDSPLCEAHKRNP